MRITKALSHYLQLLSQLDPGAQAEVISPPIARNEHTRWTACVRANRERMKSVQSAARQRRLHLLSCRLRQLSRVDTHNSIQLEFDLRCSSSVAVGTMWINEDDAQELANVGVDEK